MTAQHMVALDKANDYRLRRAQLRREVKAGDVKLSHVLSATPEPWLAKEPIGRLVRFAPRFGAQRMRKLLSGLGIRELRRVGELTNRQRWILSTELKKHDA